VRSTNAGLGHYFADASPSYHATPGLQTGMASAVGSALQRAEAVHEVEHADQRVGDRQRPIDPSASLFQRLKDNQIRPELHAIGCEPQGFGQATAGMGEEATERPHFARCLCAITPRIF
jgi:hypothetical protein